MSLLPTKKLEPTRSLSDLPVLLYGAPKIGKTTFCSQADEALILATEPGAKSLSRYEVEIPDWNKMLAVCAEIAEGNHKFKTIVIDTVDNAYEFATQYILSQYSTETVKKRHPSELGDWGVGHALINTEFKRVLTKLAALPYGLFLISHAKDKEITTPTEKYMRKIPTLSGTASSIVEKFVSIILYFDIDADKPLYNEDGVLLGYQRVIRTRPNKYWMAGNRTESVLPDTIELPSADKSFATFIDAFTKGWGKTREEVMKPVVKGASSPETAVTPPPVVQAAQATMQNEAQKTQETTKAEAKPVTTGPQVKK
jgi:hypothetical protein